MSQAAGRRSVIAWLERRFNLTEMFSFLTNFGLFPAELDTSLPIRDAVREALARPIPSYARWPRVLGILSVGLFLFLGLTGVMLAFYYQPTPSEAHESVTLLVRDVSFGWFVHQVHGWAAQAFLLILLIRAWRFFFQGLYKSPREGLWIVAILTFLAGTHSDLTGRLLGWDASGYWTTVRAVEILYSLPVLGPLFAFLVGGVDVDSLVLVRFYFLHVLMLPALLAALFFLHFSGVRRVGLSTGAHEPGAGVGLYRVYLYNLLIIAFLILGGLVTLATLFPMAFDKAADPFATPPGARPPWYLLATHGFMESFPSFVPRWLRGLAIEMILIVSIFLPFIDRSPAAPGRSRRIAVSLGLAVLALWLAFTWYGWSLETAR